MNQETVIATITEKAQAIFRQPSLVYADDLAFQKIRGFDSVRAVQFILAMEEAFGVTISEEEVDRMQTMGDLLGVIRTKVTGSV